MDLSLLRGWFNDSLEFWCSIIIVVACIDDFLEGRVFDTTVGNVVANGIVEQNTILRNDCDVGPEVVDPHLRDVLAINENLTFIEFIESVKQSHDG